MRDHEIAFSVNLGGVATQPSFHIALIADVHGIEAPESAVGAFHDGSVTSSANGSGHCVRLRDDLLLLECESLQRTGRRLVASHGVGVILRSGRCPCEVVFTFVLQHPCTLGETVLVILVMLTEILPRVTVVVLDDDLGLSNKLGGIIHIKFRSTDIGSHTPV